MSNNVPIALQTIDRSINFRKSSTASIRFDFVYSISECAFLSFSRSRHQSLFIHSKMIVNCDAIRSMFANKLRFDNECLFWVFYLIAFYYLRQSLEPILMGPCHFIIINFFFFFFFLLVIHFDRHTLHSHLKQLKRFIFLILMTDRQQEKNEQNLLTNFTVDSI